MIGNKLKAWLDQQPECQKKNDLLYIFKYKGEWCAGIVTITPPIDYLRIMPADTTIDIGQGCGCGISMEFEREGVKL